MKIHSLVQRTAWAGMVVVVFISLIAALSGAFNPYGQAQVILALLVMMIMALPLTILLYPAKPEIEEKIVYRYADERAPEGVDTQA